MEYLMGRPSPACPLSLAKGLCLLIIKGQSSTTATEHHRVAYIIINIYNVEYTYVVFVVAL